MSDVVQDRPRLSLRVHRDHLYIDAASFDVHLAHVGSVALLREKDDLLILPLVSAEAGGFFVKQINARGDRAIHAADFFRMNGIDETSDRTVDAAWSGRLAGFSIHDFFAGEPTPVPPRK